MSAAQQQGIPARTHVHADLHERTDAREPASVPPCGERLGRRGFLGSLLFASVSGVVGNAALAQAGALPATDPAAILVLYRATQPESVAFARAWAAAGCTTQALATDVVRQWRDGLGAQFAGGKRLLVGMGNWDDQLLLQGLAAEQRRHPLLVLQHPLRAQEADWAAVHAQELQALLQRTAGESQQLGQQHREQLQQTQAALQALAQRSLLQPATPSLFSWVLG